MKSRITLHIGLPSVALFTYDFLFEGYLMVFISIL
jgi:hypothetical protein